RNLVYVPGGVVRRCRALRPQPPVGTDPGPEARLTRLKRLNISARSCTFSRSRIGTSFKIEKSTLPYPGPWNLLRDTLPKSSTPPCESPTLGPVGHDPTPAAQYAVGLINCLPPPLTENLREDPTTAPLNKLSPDCEATKA